MLAKNDVAARLDLDRMSVSSAMTALDRKSLVSRGGAMSGTAWRVFVTEKGVELLNTCTENVEAALAAAYLALLRSSDELDEVEMCCGLVWSCRQRPLAHVVRRRAQWGRRLT